MGYTQIQMATDCCVCLRSSISSRLATQPARKPTNQPSPHTHTHTHTHIVVFQMLWWPGQLKPTSKLQVQFSFADNSGNCLL